jgi:hypothetical protein
MNDASPQLTIPPLAKRALSQTKGAVWIRKWRKKNPEISKARQKAWRGENHDRLLPIRRKQALKHLAVPENKIKHLIRAAHLRALCKSLEFNISIDDLLPLPTVCPVLGTPLNYAGRGSHRGIIFQSHDSASIDRINPKIGYVRGNVQIISWRANNIKGTATLEELRLLVSYMEKNR